MPDKNSKLKVSTSNVSCQNCSLAELSLPHGLSLEQLGELDQIVQRKLPYQPGEHVFRTGDESRALFAVRSGALKNYCITESGDETVAVSELSCGDHVRVKPGDSIPADGVIIEGRSSIDESLLTGESHPLAKLISDKVIGGTVNIESPLVIEVKKVGEDTVLASIQRLLDRAQLEKPSIAKTADRVAAYFVGFLLVLVSLVALWWWQHDPDQAFWIAISLLVVTCPCALSLATPAAMMRTPCRESWTAGSALGIS